MTNNPLLQHFTFIIPCLFVICSLLLSMEKMKLIFFSPHFDCSLPHRLFFSSSYYSIGNYIAGLILKGPNLLQVPIRMFIRIQTIRTSKGLQDQVLTLPQKQWVSLMIIYKRALNRACPTLDLHLKVFCCCISCT